MAEKVIRKRGWFLQRSWEYDTNDRTSKYFCCSAEDWRDGVREDWERLAQDAKVDWCHFIFHDRDELVEKNGKRTIKPIHAHAVIRYVEARTQNAVMKDFCGSNQRLENCQWVDSRKGGFRTALLYLTHHTTDAYNQEKTWYMHTDVHQFNKRYLDLIKTDSRDRKNSQDVQHTVDELVEKIMDGEIRLSSAKAKFKELEGASALVKYRAFFDAAFEEFKKFKIREMQNLSNNGLFHKRTTYISGASQTGKSALASSLAVCQVGVDDVFTAAAGGSKKITTDFVDGYETEKATIFNDIQPNEYDYRAFYNMFDPDKWSITKSRNTNKPWLSTNCYIATALSIGEFMIRMINNGESKFLDITADNASLLKQGFRRVQQLLSYGVNNSNDSVVWVGLLKDDLPTEDEIIAYFKSKSVYKIDSTVVELFYDIIGYVPYDKSITDTKQFHDERMRIAGIVDEVYNGDLNASGFVKL